MAQSIAHAFSAHACKDSTFKDNYRPAGISHPSLLTRSLSFQACPQPHPSPAFNHQHMSAPSLSSSVSDERFPFIVFKRFDEPDFRLEEPHSAPVSRSPSIRSGRSIRQRAHTEPFSAPPKIIWEVLQHDTITHKSSRHGSEESLAMKSLAALLEGRPLQM